jgi:diguanylate cyclase (GGDEF)-like protein
VPVDQSRTPREVFVERLWQGLTLLACVGAPISASRSLITGWLPLYTFHVSMALAIVVLFCVRRRLSFKVGAALLVASFWSIGLSGLFTFGLLGGSYWWLVLSSLIVSTIYSIRAGIVTAVAVTLLLAIAAAGFISGVLRPPADPTTLAASGITWASMLLTAIATPFVVFQAVAAHQSTTLALLRELQEQRDRIMRLASHDRLTGLPLMGLALDRLTVALQQAMRTQMKAAVLFIDLDGFKGVNDSAGHEAGDFVLTTVAERLQHAVRLADTAARVGGDEFIVVLGALADERIAAHIADRIIASIRRPIHYRGRSLEIGVSVGIGLYPDHATDAQSLRRAADAAMYAAKRRGSNGVVFADPLRSA